MDAATPARVVPVVRGLLAAAFVGAGAMHFISPEGFVSIVPEQLPNPELLVAVSGVAEILGGAGLLVPRVRREAGIGLVALLVAVFPANVNMAMHPESVGRGLPEAALWARLPIQLLLIWLVLVASRRKPSRSDS